jgi:hypothetical protein
VSGEVLGKRGGAAEEAWDMLGRSVCVQGVEGKRRK